MTAAQNLPDNLVIKSPVYHVDVRGRAPAQAIVTIPVPNDSLPYETLSVFEWTGEAWRHLPATIFAEDDRIEARLDFAPRHFMVAQTTPTVPAVTLDLGLAAQLPADAQVTNDARSGLPCAAMVAWRVRRRPTAGAPFPSSATSKTRLCAPIWSNNLLGRPWPAGQPVDDVGAIGGDERLSRA